MVRNILDKLTSEIQVMEANPHLYTRAALKRSGWSLPSWSKV
jgi:hypothetical protein